MLTQNFHSGSKSSQKQFNTIPQIQSQEQQSIIQWIKQNFSKSFSNCRKVYRIEQLFNGMALAEIISQYLNEDEKEIFLNQIQLIEKIQSSEDVEIAASNINATVIQIRDLFTRAMRNMKSPKITLNTAQSLIEMVEFSLKYIQNLNVQSLIGNKNKMKNFMMQVIMILPEISQYLGSTKKVQQKTKTLNSNNKQNAQSGSILIQKQQKSQSFQKSNSRLSSTKKKSSTQMKELNNQNQPAQFTTHNNIQQLSAIMGYSTANYGSNQQNLRMQSNKIVKNKNANENYDNQIEQPEQSDSQEKVLVKTQSQALFENKVQKLLNWMQSSFNLDLSTFLQPYILLGELVNCVFAPNRLKDNQKPIKPTHYELGSYSVYKKALDFLTTVQRLNKNNLIKLMKQVEHGKVNQTTFWSLVEDIYLMVKNKVSQPLKPVTKKPPRPQSVKKATQQSQKLPTQYDENINIDNIKNQSVTDMLRKQAEEGRKPNQLKDAPLYCLEVIKQTQLWLQNEMGMSHPLNKSKPQSKTVVLENPLLNGTLYSKIIQRLKIGSAKGIITPLQKKHLKNNIEIVKNQLLNRGYECVRKLSIYKPTYNFYVGLLSQIRQVHQNKENNNKKLIQNDKQKRQMQELQMEIPQQEKNDIKNWLSEEFNFKFDHKNGLITLKQMKQVIKAIVSINFLKQTTEKIRFTNYVKLFDFFKSIGFSHYSTFKVEDLLNDSQINMKKAQNLRWFVLRDLKIIKGQK